MTSICEHLEISRPTFYRYINPKVKSKPITKTTRVHLWLRVENNNKFVRRKKRVRETIERLCLPRYGMQKQHEDSWDYELAIAYQNDEDLDKQVEDLLDEMHSQADLEDCFIEADVTELGTERSW